MNIIDFFPFYHASKGKKTKVVSLVSFCHTMINLFLLDDSTWLQVALLLLYYRGKRVALYITSSTLFLFPRFGPSVSD